jgi:hypothetical protein
MTTSTKRKLDLADLLDMASDWRYSNEFLGQVLRERAVSIRNELLEREQANPYWTHRT